MIILGGGLSGCIAAHLFPGSRVLEAAPSFFHSHKALLRFRTPELGRITGIPFRKVRVHKALCRDSVGNEIVSQATPRDINFYSMKVTQRWADRSVADLSPVDRYIAPELFHRLIAEQSRIEYGRRVKEVSRDFLLMEDGERINRAEEPVISTIPMPALLEAAGMAINPTVFNRSSITVERRRLEDCDVHQTIYFSNPALYLYRASITGNLLIAESILSEYMDSLDWEAVERAFGISLDSATTPERVEQKYGKIIPVSEPLRQALMLQVTEELNVYSFGRFATWRNVLLDDLVQDAEKIRKLIKMNSYNSILEAAK